MTIEQIVAAIRALPVSERLRVIELVAHDAANDAPLAEAQAGCHGSAILTERHGLLFVHAEAVVSEEAFDHHNDREARADHLWGGS
jgi:hypothetical protein